VGVQTLRNYTVAAHLFTLLTGVPCNVYDPATLTQTRVFLHPYINAQIAQQATWTQPKPRYEPFTLKIFLALQAHLQNSSDPILAFLSMPHAAIDWCRLSLFTGSRFTEYGQSGLRKGIHFNTIPQSADAGIWAGQALAFIHTDFTFFDPQHMTIALSSVHRHHRQGLVSEVHIRFRIDKSPRNFRIHKFTSNTYLR
jgi:hypothetical protein